MYRSLFIISWVLLSVLFQVGCSKFESQREKDDLKIKNYIDENGLAATRTESGLYYLIMEEGTDGHPTIQNKVTVNYKGYLLDGSVFDQTTDNPVTFTLSGLIPGWQEGIPLLQKGGSGLFLIPSHLGYGDRTQRTIPPNSVLIFEIELVDFK